MNIGEMRHRFTLEEPSETVTTGNATVNWTTQATVWGSMRALTGRERDLHAEADVLIGIRHRSDITTRWRVGLEGTTRKFSLTEPPADPDGRKRQLLITAREVLS